MLLTQRGRGVAVLIDVREFEAMQERLELLEDVRAAKQQFAAGKGISHEEAKARTLGRFAKCTSSGPIAPCEGSTR
jgi:antitoxin YefM